MVKRMELSYAEQKLDPNSCKSSYETTGIFATNIEITGYFYLNLDVLLILWKD